MDLELKEEFPECEDWNSVGSHSFQASPCSSLGPAQVTANDNTHFAVVNDQCVLLHCRHSKQHCGKKTSIVLGYLDSSNTNGLRRALSITADKICEVVEQQNVTKRAVTPLNFDKTKGATKAQDTLLIKSPMGTGKTKALV